ncbi:MAG: cytochrome c [Acidobacteriota bacterium]
MLKPLFLLSALLLIGRPAAPPAGAPQTPTDPAKAAAAAPVPPEFLRMVNTAKPTAESQAFARKMYNFDCAMCHGANGNGKGDMAAGMKVAPKDLTDLASLKDYSDGEIYYVIKNGRGEMLGEGDRLKPDQIWNMVIYIRAFAKK